MSRPFSSPVHRRVLLWTLGLHLFAAALAWRIHWDTLAGEGSAPAKRPGAPRDPTEPDPSARTVGPEDMEALILEGSAAWAQAPAAEREAALAARLADWERMPPEAAEGAIQHVAESLRIPAVSPRWVPMEELDIDHAVPVDMENGTDGKGEAGVWVTLQDASGKRARLWVAAGEISPEETQALRVFGLLNQTPALEGLRPILTQILLRLAGKGE